MTRNAILTTLLFTLTWTLLAPATAAGGELVDALKPFEPYVGKTWRGELSDSTPEKPVIDVSRWEVALGGKAVRIVHSLNEGQYGGETLMFPDPKTGEIVYFYFTTAGFYTQGKMEFAEGKFIALEKVTGSANGVTEVKSVGEVLPDGKLHSVSHYLKDGEWVKGHEATYVEAPDAEVIF